MLRIDWLAGDVIKSHPFTRSVPLLLSLHRLLLKYRILFKVILSIYNTLLEKKRPVYLHCMLAPSLPPHSLISNKGITVSVPRVNPNTSVRVFHFGITSHCLSLHTLQLQLSGSISRRISLTWPFPHRRPMVH